MTAPMPETMSPREKVEYDHSLSNEENYRRFKAHVTALASSGDHAELARLAEDLRKFEHHAVGSLKIDMDEVRRIIAACDTHAALLAEIVALRAERDAAIERWESADGMDGAVVHAIRQVLIAAEVPTLAFIDDHVSLLVAQRNEAERKLAEAMGLHERAAELMRQCTDPERFEGVSTLNVYANMRAWLSDLSNEAERG